MKSWHVGRRRLVFLCGQAVGWQQVWTDDLSGSMLAYVCGSNCNELLLSANVNGRITVLCILGSERGLNGTLRLVRNREHGSIILLILPDSHVGWRVVSSPFLNQNSSIDRTRKKNTKVFILSDTAARNHTSSREFALSGNNPQSSAARLRSAHRTKMMAHNLSTHALTSALSHRSSSFLSHQDHQSVRHISVVTMPDILEAFNHSQAVSSTTSLSTSVRNSGTDSWELPELKWLDPADNVAGPSENLPEAENSSLASEKFPIDGERWPLTFSSFCPGDRVVPNSEEAQFSLQSIVSASPASSGSSVLMKGRMNFVSGRDFPSSSAQAPEWRSTSGNKRPPSERPDSEFAQEKLSNSERSSFKDTSIPEMPASNNSDVSALPTTYPPEKRSRTVTADARGNRDSCVTLAGSGPDQKVSIEKGSVSVTNDQTVSPSRDSKKSANTVSDHEIHIWTERERRKKMNGMFSTLHSLLPHLTSKADKSTIVDEAINYIQSLEVTMKSLIKRKGEMANSSSTSMPTSLARLQASQHGMGETDSVCKVSPTISFSGEIKSSGSGSSSPTSEAQFRTQCSKNVVLNMCGNDAFITICSPRGRLGLLCRVLFVIESHNLHVLNAHICNTNETIMYMVHAQTTESQLGNSDMLNIALQDLTKCLSAHS